MTECVARFPTLAITYSLGHKIRRWVDELVIESEALLIISNNLGEDDEIKWTVTFNKGANGYRLPTEVEWEYAA